MYKTGETYKEFITQREGIAASLKENGLTLKFLWKNPDETIIKSLSSEPFFQLYFKSGIMFLLLKFNDLKWVDVPCIFQESVRAVFSSDFERFPCNVMLINSNTGKLFVNETYHMAEGTTKAFIQGIHTQKPIKKRHLLEKINSIRSSFSASEMSRLSLGTIR